MSKNVKKKCQNDRSKVVRQKKKKERKKKKKEGSQRFFSEPKKHPNFNKNDDVQEVIFVQIWILEKVIK